jgi:hypothetical protein
VSHGAVAQTRANRFSRIVSLAAGNSKATSLDNSFIARRLNDTRVNTGKPAALTRIVVTGLWLRLPAIAKYRLTSAQRVLFVTFHHA